jgi:hypothetical protein
VVPAAFDAFAQDAPLLPTDRSEIMVVGAGFLAFAVSLIVWPIVRFAITIAHEGGHAVTASMMGGKVNSIKLHRTGGGVTHFKDTGPFGTFLTALAGYTGPSIFGLIGAMLLSKGHVDAVLYLSLFFLVLALLRTGNFFGGLAVVLTGAMVFVVARYGSSGQQTFFAYTWVWFLLFGGFGHVLALQRLRGEGKDDSSDAFQLKAMTFLPASLWSGFFWLGSLAALVYGGGILLGLVQVG